MADQNTTMKTMKETAHVAILPSPGMGHFIPMVELAKTLVLKHNVTATLLVPGSTLHGGHGPIEQLLKSLPPGANHVLLPPPEFHESESDLRFEMRIALTIPRSLPSIRRALESLTTKTAKLAALVVDFFGTAAFSVAREIQVSAYMFCPCSAAALSLFMYLPKLETEASPPPQLIQFPGCDSLREEDFPFPDRQSIGYKWFVENANRYLMAEGIMVNTFSDLEGGVLKALQNNPQLNYPPIFPIGPLIRMETDSSVSMNIDQELLNWLDRRPRGSILFLCFGSFGLLSNSQLRELAHGIELSKKGFVWVVWGSSGESISALPEGFVEKTKGRGMLVTNWVPQSEILSHRSIGGFLTHCGWNSVLEGVANGVPMIAWPLYAEQRMNAAMIAEELKIALWPGREGNGGGLVDRNVIAETVNEVMEGEEGKRLCRRVRELKDAAEEALSEDGCSTRCMAELCRKWKKTIAN